MRLSHSVIFAPVPGREQTLLVQPLSGQVALLEQPLVDQLKALDGGGGTQGLPLETLREAHFVVESDDEDRALLAEAYAGFLEEQQHAASQLILVPSFGCNLKCTYCYQEVFDPEGRGLISNEMLDGFFRYVDRYHGQDPVKPYITLFGGEPLVDSPLHHERIGRVLREAKARGLGVAAVTNGYDLVAWADELAAASMKEVQVTLDGPPPVHNVRRPTRAGGETFARIEQGIDALVARGVPVNLRVVVDKDNMAALPELAAWAEKRGWLDLPSGKFKTQVGRNYELFGCTSRQSREQLFDRVELWTRFVELAEQHPVLKRFHQPRFHGLRHLADVGEFPAPNFDACPAAKREWAFAPDGALYGCTATVGNADYRLGSFAPVPERNDAAVARWQTRNVFSIPKCITCDLAPVCGGGCGALSSEKGGNIVGPDCRPVRELMGIGARYYGLA